MPDNERHLLNHNRPRLVKDLIANDEFFAVLISDHTLTSSMIEEITAAKTTQSKVGRLLDVLPKRGAKAFGALVEALHETHQGHLANLLDPSGAIFSQRSGGVASQPSNQSGAASSPGCSGVISQPADARGSHRLSPSDTSSSNQEHTSKDQETKSSQQPSDGQEQKPVQEVTPVDSHCGNPGETIDDSIIRLINEFHTSKVNIIDADSNALKCVGGGETSKETKVLLRNGRGTCFSNQAFYDNVNLCAAFKRFGFEIKIQNSKEEICSLVVESEAATDASAFIHFVFTDNSSVDFISQNIETITENLKKSAVLKGKPKVLIFQIIGSVARGTGVQTDSNPEDMFDRFRGLSLETFGSDDNMAVLKVVSKERQEIPWLVWSLVILLMKYSKTFDLSTMLKHVKDILNSQNISAQLSSSLKDGLYFTTSS